MLGQHLVLVMLHHGLELVMSKAIRIGDTKYDIQCRYAGPSISGAFASIIPDL